MEKKLLNKNQSLRLFGYALVTILGINSSFGQSQQVLGHYPSMDGGFENQAETTAISGGGSTSAPDYNNWTVSTTTGSATRSIVADALKARSGQNYAEFGMTSTGTNLRLQTPASPSENILNNSTDYIVQYFYKTNTDPTGLGSSGNSALTGAIYVRGTGGSTIVPTTSTFTSGQWVKYAEKLTTVASTSATASATAANPGNFACVRIAATAGTYLGTVQIDDFIVYQGTEVDVIAPTAPTAPSYYKSGNTVTLTWTDAVGGVDGGGYMVVRYATNPSLSSDPNQNGVYKVGSAIGTGIVVSLGTTNTVEITNPDSADYFYKIYTVDKAFNYSDEILANSTLSTARFELPNFKLFPNPVKDIVNLTNTEAISKVEIFTLLGQKIKEFTGNKTEIQIDLSNLEKGIYLVKVTSEGKSQTVKLNKK